VCNRLHKNLDIRVHIVTLAPEGGDI